MGFKIMTKSKNWQFFHENHQLGKVVEMKGIDGTFVPIGFSRTGTERLKNWSGKCEGPGEGGSTGQRTRVGNVKDRPGGNRQVKKPEWEM
jgi:hypothetical protein